MHSSAAASTCAKTKLTWILRPLCLGRGSPSIQRQNDSSTISRTRLTRFRSVNTDNPSWCRRSRNDHTGFQCVPRVFPQRTQRTQRSQPQPKEPQRHERRRGRHCQNPKDEFTAKERKELKEKMIPTSLLCVLCVLCVLCGRKIFAFCGAILSRRAADSFLLRAEHALVLQPGDTAIRPSRTG